MEGRFCTVKEARRAPLSRGVACWTMNLNMSSGSCATVALSETSMMPFVDLI